MMIHLLKMIVLLCQGLLEIIDKNLNGIQDNECVGFYLGRRVNDLLVVSYVFVKILNECHDPYISTERPYQMKNDANKQ